VKGLSRPSCVETIVWCVRVHFLRPRLNSVARRLKGPSKAVSKTQRVLMLVLDVV
jgi:hypothetical protein